MNSALGYGFTILGLTASVLGAAGGAYGLITDNKALLKSVRQWSWLVLAAGIGAAAVMQIALAQRDYSVAYVTKVGSDGTPTLFNIAAMWSALEGSILLWTLLLGFYVGAMLWKYKDRGDDPLFMWALVVVLVVSSFFFGLMAGPANPFGVVDVPFGFNGPGPNPLLQNHILVAFHPPTLYLGYVGFTIPFAFAIAALITGRTDEGWLGETRRWTLAAWGFLSVGIILGSWWSYEVLGWGGFWAWDPVENASLLPWLTGTAYIHSVMVQERRGMLRVWNLSLLVSTFALTILGTFLTRSGVVNSVHAFSDGTIGPMLLGFFALITLVSVGLIGWRGDQLRSPGSIKSPLSREAAFFANNVAFGAFAFIVLLGTVFPLIYEAYDGTRLTIGRPYFDSMGTPVGFLILFLMAVAPVLPWKKTTPELLSSRLFWPAVFGVAAMVLSLALGGRNLSAVIAFGLGGFASGSAIRHLFLNVKRSGLMGLVGRSNGGMIVHLGVIIIAMGIASSESFKTDQSATLNLGESVMVEDHEFTYLELKADRNDRRDRVYALVQIDGGDIYAPAVLRYASMGQPISTPSVRSGFTEDVYLVLDRVPSEAGGPIGLRVILRPMMTWLWGGGMLMAVGTAMALIPPRRRKSV